MKECLLKVSNRCPTVLAAPIVVGLFLASLTGCGPAAQSVQAEGTQLVPTACASCIYEMEGVNECTTAVKVDGKAYLVTGTTVDAHNVGLCSGEKKAEVTGQVEGDKFVATSFKLVE